MDTENYKHKFLPNGEDLKVEELRADIMNILQRFVPHARQLSPCGFSEANESFNNIVASKTSKALHYGGSELNDFRVSAAVCQNNIDTHYVTKGKENLLKKSINFKKGRCGLWTTVDENCQIVQKAAFVKSDQFIVYILPTQKLHTQHMK